MDTETRVFILGNDVTIWAVISEIFHFTSMAKKEHFQIYFHGNYFW